ncbi:MAG: hypothetical protein ABIL06_00465 [Pseudomonadota bacterium]
MHGRPIIHVLGYFGRTVGQAKKAYLNFMEEGIAQGRREDLTGGGLIRSVGGWAQVKQLKRQGYDADRIAKRVAEIYDMDVREVLSRGKQQQKVNARSLFCFWAVKELDVSLRELASRLELSPPAVGYSVERGEAIARQNGYRLQRPHLYG